MIIAQRTIPAVQPSAPSFGANPTPSHYDVYNPVPAQYSVPTTTSSDSSLISNGDNFDGLLGDAGLLDIIQRLLVIAFIAAGLLSAIFIFYGGISFILSGGNDEKIKKAVNTIRYAIIGLIITIFSFTFVTIVGRFFGLNLLDYISWDMIKTSITDIVQTAKSTGNFTAPRR